MTDPRYFLKKPAGKRKTFSIVCYIPVDRKTKEYLDLPERLQLDVVNINKKFKEEVITAGEAETLLNDLIAVEYRKSAVKSTALKAVVLSEANSKILAKFWNDKYEVRYHADGGKSARNDFARVFRAIEPLSIQSSSQLDLHNALKKNLSNVNQVRRACERLNEVLRWLGRGFQLVKPKKGRKIVKHLTKAEIYKALPHIACPECKLLAEALFCTGMRIGESMALIESDLYDLELNVDKQRVNYGKKEEKLPKREKTGKIVVFAFGIRALKHWIAIDDKWAHREHFNDSLGKACVKAGLKRVTAHDLRHSHAIHILTIGGTLSDVSLNLRDRIEVCQEYYTGYSHTEGTLDRLKRLTSETTKK